MIIKAWQENTENNMPALKLNNMKTQLNNKVKFLSLNGLEPRGCSRLDYHSQDFPSAMCPLGASLENEQSSTLVPRTLVLPYGSPGQWDEWMCHEKRLKYTWEGCLISCPFGMGARRADSKHPMRLDGDMGDLI